MTKVTLFAVPVHLSIAMLLVELGDSIDRLWADTETVAEGKCKVLWPVVCRPTDIGAWCDGLVLLRICAEVMVEVERC